MIQGHGAPIALDATEMVEAFLAASAGLAPATIYYYRSILMPFTNRYGTLPRDPAEIIRFVRRLPRLHGQSPLVVTTRRSYYKAIVVFYAWVKAQRDLSLPRLPYEGFGRKQRRWRG